MQQAPRPAHAVAAGWVTGRDTLDEVMPVDRQRESRAGRFRHRLPQGPDAVEGAGASGRDLRTFGGAQRLVRQRVEMALPVVLDVDADTAATGDGDGGQAGGVRQRDGRAGGSVPGFQGWFAEAAAGDPPVGVAGHPGQQGTQGGKREQGCSGPLAASRVGPVRRRRPDRNQTLRHRRIADERDIQHGVHVQARTRRLSKSAAGEGGANSQDMQAVLPLPSLVWAARLSGPDT